MWDCAAIDILSHIFSFLPPQAIAQCLSTSKHWQAAAKLTTTTTTSMSAMWLLAMPTHAHSDACFAYEPCSDRWHSLPLTFLPFPIRSVAVVGSLLLCKLGNSLLLRFVAVNVFTKQFRLLPELGRGLRSNAAVGLVVDNSAKCPSCFRIFVAGGASGGSYEQSVEVYDSNMDAWSSFGPMPMEYAVRLTVWTPNESIHCKDGTIYWMTSARAYSVVGFSPATKAWREVKVPKADKLEWATIVKRINGKLGLVGGEDKREGCIWELCEGDAWENVGHVPKIEGENSLKCVGTGDGRLWVFKGVGRKMLVGDGNEWMWSGGECCWLPQISTKVVAVEPSLSRFAIGFGNGGGFL